MKKTLYLFLAVSVIFTACKKEEGCTDSSATNYNADAEEDDGSCTYSIVGVWEPNTIDAQSYVLNPLTQTWDLFMDTTMTAQGADMIGNMEFTNSGTVLSTNDDGYQETENYTTSGSTLTITDYDGEVTEATYTVSKTNLSIFIPGEDEYNDGWKIDMTINATRQ